MPTCVVARRFLRCTLAVGLAAVGVVALPGVAAADSYEVQEGETLSHVALRTQTSMNELRDLNGLGDVDMIFAGQVLLTSPPTSTYTVASGDTLSGIAVAVGSSTSELVSLNGLTNDDRIRVGQALMVPTTGAPSAGASTAAATIDLNAYPNLPQRILDRPERIALIPIFEKWAAANDLPVDLLMATAWHESGWNQDAESWAGAVGVGQLMPVTAVWVATTLIGNAELDRFDAEDNIRISARYLDWLLDRNDGDVRLALGGYFQGPTSVSSGKWLDATELYAANVTAQRSLFSRSSG